MDKFRPIFLAYFSISLAVLSTLFYHIFQKLTPPNANPALAMILTYGVATAVCVALLLVCFPPKAGLVAEIRQLNWASAALALTVAGIEFGFLFAYRAGWKISLAGIVVNILATILLVPIGMLAFKEKVSAVNLIGIIFCLVGLVMVNWRR